MGVKPGEDARIWVASCPVRSWVYVVYEIACTLGMEQNQLLKESSRFIYQQDPHLSW